jgi:TPR repeat protein
MRSAAYYFKLPAHQGDAGAQFNSGNCLHSGEGISTNVRNAAYYFKLAIDQGLAQAEFNYGNCLQNGKRVSIDMRTGAHYFNLAADQDGIRRHQSHCQPHLVLLYPFNHTSLLP